MEFNRKAISKLLPPLDLDILIAFADVADLSYRQSYRQSSNETSQKA
jgi:hypothetical protein